MPYGKTPMKKKGSMMYMGHDSAAKMYGSKSAMKMGHDSPMKMGHDSPMKKQGSWMSKHSTSALHMGHDSPMKMESDKQKKKNLLQDMPIDDKASAMQMSYSPMKKYDRVVLGGNKGDKSKTKPGKKDFMQ